MGRGRGGSEYTILTDNLHLGSDLRCMIGVSIARDRISSQAEMDLIIYTDSTSAYRLIISLKRLNLFLAFQSFPLNHHQAS